MMREMCGVPGCPTPEIVFDGPGWWSHVAGDQGHAAIVGTPARVRLGSEKPAPEEPVEPASWGPVQVMCDVALLPRNARRLVELATPVWTMRWSRVDGVVAGKPRSSVVVQGRRQRVPLHAVWRDEKFDACRLGLRRLSSEEMFEYVQRED